MQSIPWAYRDKNEAVAQETMKTVNGLGEIDSDIHDILRMLW